MADTTLSPANGGGHIDPLADISVSIPGAPSNGAGATDPFSNLDALRAPQDYAMGEVLPTLTAVQIGVPSSQAYFRIRKPDENPVKGDPTGGRWYSDFLLFRKKGEAARDRDRNYLVLPKFAPYFEDACQINRLFVGITKQGTVFMYPIPLNADGLPLHEWAASRFKVVAEARERWIRVRGNQESSSYTISPSPNPGLKDPVWPENYGYMDLLKLAFRDGRLVDREDHPAIKDFLGY